MRTPLVWLMAASFVFGGAARHRQDVRLPRRSPERAQAGLPRLLPAPETANLIGTYCVSCHNDRAKTGGLSLQTLRSPNLPEHADVWEKVARKLRSGEMPPSTVRSRPDAKQAEAFAVFVETTLDRAAASRPNPGRAPVHRLNRAEYSNAVRDLLAVDVRPGEWLPVDDSGYGFDNIAAVLSTSPALLDRYMSAARKVSRLAVGDLTLKPVEEIYDAKRDPNKGSRERAVERRAAVRLARRHDGRSTIFRSTPNTSSRCGSSGVQPVGEKTGDRSVPGARRRESRDSTRSA